MNLDAGAASALLGISVVEVLSTFREVAPSLSDVRSSTSDNPKTNQGLLDAEIMGGIVALVLAGGASFLMKSPLPLLLSSVGLFLITQYYRSVLKSLPV